MAETAEYTNEAYRNGDRVLIVHERANGNVYYHLQHWNDHVIYLNNFFRLPEKEFAERLQASEGEAFDVNTMPAAQLGEPNF